MLVKSAKQRYEEALRHAINHPPAELTKHGIELMRCGDEITPSCFEQGQWQKHWVYCEAGIWYTKSSKRARRVLNTFLSTLLEPDVRRIHRVFWSTLTLKNGADIQMTRVQITLCVQLYADAQQRARLEQRQQRRARTKERTREFVAELRPLIKQTLGPYSVARVSSYENYTLLSISPINSALDWEDWTQHSLKFMALCHAYAATIEVKIGENRLWLYPISQEAGQ